MKIIFTEKRACCVVVCFSKNVWRLYRDSFVQTDFTCPKYIIYKQCLLPMEGVFYQIFLKSTISHLNIGFFKIRWQNFILLLDAVEVHKITRPRPQTQRHHSSISFCFGRYEMMCVECSFVKLRAIKVLNLMKVFTRLEMVWSKSNEKKVLINLWAKTRDWF